MHHFLYRCLFYCSIFCMVIISCILLNMCYIKKIAVGGDRTHDHKIKSLALYRLSYDGINYILAMTGFDPVTLWL